MKINVNSNWIDFSRWVEVLAKESLYGVGDMAGVILIPVQQPVIAKVRLMSNPEDHVCLVNSSRKGLKSGRMQE